MALVELARLECVDDERYLLCGGERDVDHDGVCRFLECFELRTQEACGHEMAGTSVEACFDQLEAAAEVDEGQRGTRASKLLPVGALQRRTRQNQASLLRVLP